MVMAIFNLFNMATSAHNEIVAASELFPHGKIPIEEIGFDHLHLHFLLVNFSYVTIQTLKIYCIK
jgi:hypothetical protein